MEEIIVAEGAGKLFGETKVLDGISFSCGTSEILGTIKIRQRLLGKEVDIPERMGVLIETPAFLAEFNAYDNLRILAGINHEIGDDRVKEVLEQFGLDWRSRKRVGKYSMGMRQRLGLAQAVMENPDILILDEPMNGLDVHWIEMTRKLLLEMKAQGKAILLASHNKEDIDFLCDRIIRLEGGKMV